MPWSVGLAYPSWPGPDRSCLDSCGAGGSDACVAAGPAHANDPLSLVGQTLGGRFQIERFVAEGGFGIVYRARQVALDRPVAIKILKAAPDLRHETFEAEAKTVA